MPPHSDTADVPQLVPPRSNIARKRLPNMMIINELPHSFCPRRNRKRDGTEGLDTTSIHAAQSFSPNWRTAIRLLRGYEEGARAPNPEIGLLRTVSRNLSLIINTIRWLPVRQFGEKTFDGNEKPRGQDPPGISAEPFAPLTFSAEPKFAAIILSLAASRLPKAERSGWVFGPGAFFCAWNKNPERSEVFGESERDARRGRA